MERKDVRVIVASESPKVQYFLREVVEEEGGVATVGQAQDASEVLTLARNLSPDVAIIDCYLPYVVGFDDIPLSRIGGLDIAQAISGEIPNIRVILLNNLDAEVSSGYGLGLGKVVFFSRKTNGSNTPFTLQQLYQETEPPSSLVFANVEVKQQVVLRQKVASISDKAIFFGGLAIAGGWLLTITMVFAPVGVPLALAGVATMLLGLAVKLTPSLWRRLLRKRARP